MKQNLEKAEYYWRQYQITGSINWLIEAARNIKEYRNKGGIEAEKLNRDIKEEIDSKMRELEEVR